MTTPSDKFPANGPETETDSSDLSGQNRDQSESEADAQPAKSPPILQGLPLYMRAPRHALPADAGKAASPGAFPAASPDTASGGQPAEAMKKPAPFPLTPDDFPGMTEKDGCPTIAVDAEGTASCLPPDTPAGREKEKPVAEVDAPEHADPWDYTQRPWAKQPEAESQAQEPASGKADSLPGSAGPVPGAQAKAKKGGWFGKPKTGQTAAKKTAAPKEAPKKLPPFSASHPILSVTQTMPPSVGSRIFSALALSPLIVLTVMLLIQTIFSLDARALWFSDEIRHADAFKNLLDHGKWLVLEMNGAPYPDKPPLYFWFLRGLYELLRTDGPLLHFTAAAISGLLFLWASVALGRHVARVDGKTNLAAGIILLSTGYFMGLLHYARMDLLFSALIICSNIALYRAFVSPRPDFPGMVAAFVLAGLACLVKGPLAFAFPLAAIVLFALWRGTADQVRCVVISIAAVFFGLLPGLFGPDLLRLAGITPPTIVNPLSGNTILALEWGLAFLAPPLVIGLLLLQFAPKLRLCTVLSILLMAAVFVLNGSTPHFHWPPLYTLPVAALALLVLWQTTPQRFFRLDFFAGIIAGLLVPALWLGAIYLETGSYDFILNSLLKTQVLERAVDTFHHKEPWHYYLLRFPLMLLPWFILVFFLPWKKLVGKDNREALAASRRPEKEGIAYLWCMGVSALAMLSLLSGKILIYLLPVLPAFAILAARGVLGLTGARARLFRYSMAFMLFLFGAAAIVGALMLFGILPMPGLDFVPGWKLAGHGGFYVIAAIAFVIVGLLAFGLRSSRPEGVLLYMALGCSLLGFPLASLVAPSFDAVLSPKAQALIMRAYINEGYAPASYKVYGGTYSFYTNSVINELKKQEDILPLAEKGKLVLGMRASIFDAWEDAPECLTEVHRQWIETREFVLLACPPVEDLKPAPVPYKESPDIIREAFRQFGIELPGLGGAATEPEGQKIVRKTPVAPQKGQDAQTPAAESPDGAAGATEGQAVTPPTEDDGRPQPGAATEAPAANAVEQEQPAIQPTAPAPSGQDENRIEPPAESPETNEDEEGDKDIDGAPEAGASSAAPSPGADSDVPGEKNPSASGDIAPRQAGESQTQENAE